MKALYFGTYDRRHPRNINAIAALEAAGVEVTERSAPVRSGGLLGTLLVLAAEARLLLPRRREFDVLIVGYPGHFDVPRARRVAGTRPLVFDAVLSLEDELIGVRRRYRARSPAATVLRAVDARALNLPDVVVCGTETEARYLRTVGAEDVEAIYLGADEDLYCETWSPAYPFTALHVADASTEVVRAAAALTDVPVRVAIRGEIRRDDFGIALAHAGIVLGSFRDSRAIPPVVFDALSTGAPVITASTDATRELLRDEESALLVPPGDPDALARAIERLEGDDELRRSMAAAGRRAFVEHASREALGARWLAVLERLTASGRRGSASASVSE